MKNHMEKIFGRVKEGLLLVVAFIVLFALIVSLACMGAKAEASSGNIGVNGLKKISSLMLSQDGVYVFKDNSTNREYLIFYLSGEGVEVVAR